MNEIKIGGIYAHYKGKDRLYEVVGLAKHSETLEDMVIYKALYKGDFPDGQLWARPAAMWSEPVNGAPRFRLAEGK